MTDKVYQFTATTRFSSAYAAAKEQITDYESMKQTARFALLDQIIREDGKRHFANWNGGDNKPMLVELLSDIGPELIWQITFDDPQSAMLFKLANGGEQ